MGWPGGQNDRTPCESILMLSRGSQLPYTSIFLWAIFSLYFLYCLRRLIWPDKGEGLHACAAAARAVHPLGASAPPPIPTEVAVPLTGHPILR